MNRRPGLGLSLRERSARVGAGAEPEHTAPRRLGQHCWVLGDVDPIPALLVEWRRADDGSWEGRIIHLDQHLGREAVVDVWLPAALLRPATP